jgi:hypothetical protein
MTAEAKRHEVAAVVCATESQWLDVVNVLRPVAARSAVRFLTQDISTDALPLTVIATLGSGRT